MRAPGASAPLFDDAPVAHGPVIAQAPDRELLQIARRIPADIHLGTSSWNFPGWRGIVWSRASSVNHLAQKGLEAYAKHPIFKTTGIDRAYYRPLSVEVYADFAAQVPENFRFLVKAPQAVTDSVRRDIRGRPVADNPDYLNVDMTLETFVHPALEGLRAKAGVLIFELSAIPRRKIADIAEQYEAIERMAAFFTELMERMPATGTTVAVEMRSRILLTPRWVKNMMSTGVRPVISLHPAMPSVMRQTDMLRMFDNPGGAKEGKWKAAGDIVIRWSLASGGTYAGLKEDWAPFDRIRREDIVTREGIVWLLKLAAASGVRAFAVANNKAEGCAPLTMRAVAQSLTLA